MLLSIAHTVSLLSLSQTWQLSCDVPVNAGFLCNKTAMLRKVWSFCHYTLTSQFPYAPCEMELITSNSEHQPWQKPRSFCCCAILWCMLWVSMLPTSEQIICIEKEYSWYCTVLHTMTVLLQTVILYYKVRLHMWAKYVEQQVLPVITSVQNVLIKFCLQCKVHNFTTAQSYRIKGMFKQPAFGWKRWSNWR